MNFFTIAEVPGRKKGDINIAPNFLPTPADDFMIRGRSFYAIWDQEANKWSTNEADVIRIVDNALREYLQKVKARQTDSEVKYHVQYMNSSLNPTWKNYKAYLQSMFDTFHQLDTSLTFLSDRVKKSDYSSKRLPYDIREGSIENYDKLIGTLYEPEERQKLEWAIGSIVCGDSKSLQKFIVLHGEPGSGKSTFMNIVEKLFEGYVSVFDAKALGSNNHQFSTAAFASDPLVAIQHDGDLSKLEDNTKINSIVSHEPMEINVKFKPGYTSRMNAMLFMGTNEDVKITGIKSGLTRRMIDVFPSGTKLPEREYFITIEGIQFELSAIAHHCLQVYNKLGRHFYSRYVPTRMIFQSNMFYNFIDDIYDTLIEQDPPRYTLKQLYTMYKEYCAESKIERVLPMYKVKTELMPYFKAYKEDYNPKGGRHERKVYIELDRSKFFRQVETKDVDASPLSLVLDSSVSILDDLYSDCPAQYSNEKGTPSQSWSKVTTKLSDLDTNREHYVRLPLDVITIDFDLKDSDGKKSRALNLEAASSWPSTYSEYSKSGEGLHLHYIYDGDVSLLANEHSEGVEIKKCVGLTAIRRKLSKCNNRSIAHLSEGVLPLKEAKPKVIDSEVVMTEKSLRKLIERNLNKEIHSATAPSVDFIHKILEDAYNSGLRYDLRDMRGSVLSFAMSSTNQSERCVELVTKMKFVNGEEAVEEKNEIASGGLVFFDVEVFPNLFLVVWKEEGENKQPVVMINPSPIDIEKLFEMKLVGFNNRRYDNHMLYGRYLGYNNEQMYRLSGKLVGKVNDGTFLEAYNISYTDIYDFSSKRQSLKKFEIDLDIHHQEMEYDWDLPLPEDKWSEVVSYCINDVLATEAVFKSRKQDWNARLILSELSGLTPNHTSQQHTAKIIFGNERRPQSKFVYTDLSTIFPGYSYDPMRVPKSLYREEDPSEGGYVYAQPGIWENVVLLDVQSMHPTSIIELNAFGPYTENFKALLDARLAIKHKDYEMASNMLGGTLKKYLGTEADATALSNALKIVINIVYGLTSASFENKFNDPRNKDNVVAKRGALFMIDLRHEVESRGFTVAHIKTDSIKIVNATPEIVDFVNEFGVKYGYSFSHEATYERMCLVNDAVYIARYGWSDDSKSIGRWTATGAQFAHPYIFKNLFSHEELVFKDYCETKEVKTSMYLDFNEGLENDQHNYVHVGKVGLFVPVVEGVGGGVLLRLGADGVKYSAVTGTKGYRWLEAEVVKTLDYGNMIDFGYFENLLKDAIDSIGKHGDSEKFCNVADPNPIGFDELPFESCGTRTCESCGYLDRNYGCKLGFQAEFKF